MSYEYWNAFIEDWKTGNSGVDFPGRHGWAHPDTFQLMNRTGQDDASINYIPEPWWGNSGNGNPLHSVVINYNPGEADILQSHRARSNLYKFRSYQQFVSSESSGQTNLFSRTNNWHRNKRALRVISAVRNFERLNNEDFLGLENHLSLELIPWHTQNIANINNYIAGNLIPIFENILCFAAERSRKIENKKLFKKVILRISGERTLKLLKLIKEADISDFQSHDIIRTQNQKGSFMQFRFTRENIKDISFVSIWGINSRNDFPPPNAMIDIFKNL
jgi:hypothetical protein